MGRTANSKVKRATFYVKVRNYVHYTRPTGGWDLSLNPLPTGQPTYPWHLTNHKNPIMFDLNTTDRFNSAGDYYHPWTGGNTDAFDAPYGNKWFGTIDWTKKVRDVHGEYPNLSTKTWKVSATGNWDVNISAKLQMGITLGLPSTNSSGIDIPTSVPWNPTEPCKINAAVIGTMHLCKLPYGNTQSIWAHDVFGNQNLLYDNMFNPGNVNGTSENPYLNIPGIQILDTCNLMIQYNQDYAGAGYQPYPQTSGGNGSIWASQLGGSNSNDLWNTYGFNWTWDTIDSKTPRPTWFYAGTQGSPGTTWPTERDLKGQNKNAYEYRDSYISNYSIDSGNHSAPNLITHSGNVNPNGNEYSLGLTQTHLDKGDRVFVVAGYQYCTCDPSLPLVGLGNSMPAGYGKSIYQWDGAYGMRSTGSTAVIAHNSGEFIAKKVM